MTLRSMSCKVYILMRCTDIFIKFMEGEEENRAERCRLWRVHTICCSACVHFGRCLHFSPLMMVVFTLNTVALPPAALSLTSWCTSIFCFGSLLALFSPSPSISHFFLLVGLPVRSCLYLDQGRIPLVPSCPC